MSAAQLIVGRVQHARTRPARNAFTYPIFNVRLPLESLANAASALAIERGGVARINGERLPPELTEQKPTETRASPANVPQSVPSPDGKRL